MRGDGGGAHDRGTVSRPCSTGAGTDQCSSGEPSSSAETPRRTPRTQPYVEPSAGGNPRPNPAPTRRDASDPSCHTGYCTTSHPTETPGTPVRSTCRLTPRCAASGDPSHPAREPAGKRCCRTVRPASVSRASHRTLGSPARLAGSAHPAASAPIAHTHPSSTGRVHEASAAAHRNPAWRTPGNGADGASLDACETSCSNLSCRTSCSAHQLRAAPRSQGKHMS